MKAATTLKTQDEEIFYPPILDRIQSGLIDILLIIALMFVAGIWLDRYENAPDWIRIVIFFALWGIYEPLCCSLGGTIGNHAKGIRVRSHRDKSKRINIFQAFVRYITKMTLGSISFVTVHLNKEQRAIHDYMSGSIMIKK